MDRWFFQLLVISSIIFYASSGNLSAEPKKSKTRDEIVKGIAGELRDRAPDIIRMLPELTDPKAREIKPGTYAFVQGKQSSNFAVQQLSKLQSDFSDKKRKASYFKTANNVLFTLIGASAGYAGAEIGYEASEFINSFVDAGLDKTYRQIVVDSEAIVNVAFNEASDERVNRAKEFIRRARELESAGDLQGALEYRKAAADESLQSGAFTQGLANNETCKKIGPEACKLATRRIIETNSVRIDLNQQQIRDLDKKAAANAVKIDELSNALETFKEQANNRLGDLEQTQKALKIELGVVSRDITVLNDRVDFQGKQIGFIQHSLWKNMTPGEKLSALRTGGFFPWMSKTDRADLEKSLKAQKEQFESVKKWGDRVKFMGAASGLVNEISRLDSDLISPDFAAAVSKATFVADIAHQAFSLFETGDITTLTSWSAGISIATNALKLFGKPKPDPDQLRFQALMKALNVVNEKLEEVLRLQRETLLAIEEIDRKLVELDRSVNKRFDRLEEKIDYLTDLVSSSTVLPRSDACIRIIKQGIDNFGFNPETGFYDTYESRVAHWISRDADMETCFNYVSQVSTMYRTQGSSVDAVFQIPARNNDAATAQLKQFHKFLTSRVREIFRYSEGTDTCLRYQVLVGSSAPQSFTEMRPYFSYVENLARLGCAALPENAEPAVLTSASETRAPAEAKWALVEQQIEQDVLLTFADVVLYTSAMKRLLVSSANGSGREILPASAFTEDGASFEYKFIGRNEADDDLEKLSDLLDIAIAQEALKSGLLFLPFIEAALIENDFGFAPSLPEAWRQYMQEAIAYEELPRVTDLKKERVKLSEERSQLVSRTFDTEFLDRRSLYMDQQLARLEEIANEIETIDAELAKEKANSGFLMAEHKVVTDQKTGLGCNLPQEFLTTIEKKDSEQVKGFELSDQVLDFCFSQLGGAHPSDWSEIHKYLLAVYLLESYPEMARNFWIYVSIKNLTEGAYEERGNCAASSSGQSCTYAFDGVGGNRIGTTDIALNVARQARTDSLLQLILPDMRFADLTDKATCAQKSTKLKKSPEDECAPASWTFVWVGTSGVEQNEQVPLTQDLMGDTGQNARRAAPISYTRALQTLAQKRRQIEKELVLEEWVTTTLENDEYEKEELAEAIYTLNLLQN